MKVVLLAYTFMLLVPLQLILLVWLTVKTDVQNELDVLEVHSLIEGS